MSEILARITTGRAFALGIGLAVIYYFLVYDSGATQTARIAQAKAQVAEIKDKLHEDQLKLDRAAVYKKAASDTGSTINKLLAAIPEHFDIPDLMKMVSNETKVAGTSLLNITPGLTTLSTLSKEFEEISVNVDMNGSFLQQMVFLSNLTKINQILVIHKFEISLGNREIKGDEPPQVHMTAEIVAYRYRGAAASAADAAKAAAGTTK